MAYIIAVCGAGGKSTYIRKRAEQYAAEGKKTAVSTTTHIGCPAFFLRCGAYGTDAAGGSGRTECAEISCQIYQMASEHNPKISYDIIGMPVMDDSGNGSVQKLSFPGEELYRRMCRAYDVILLEADGSRHYPIKIPAFYEPVIPENADEIVIVMGLQAVGRKFGTVCQRAELLLNRHERAGDKEKNREADKKTEKEACTGRLINDITAETVISEELIRAVAETFYLNPLYARFPNKKIELYLNDMKNWVQEEQAVKPQERKAALVLLASGFSRRFGSNKLLQILNDRPLYWHVLSQMEQAAELLLKNGIRTEIFVCTTYPEIERELWDRIRVFHNQFAEEGISASIRLGAKEAEALHCSDIVYFAADMPFLPAEDIARYIEQYLYSGKNCAVMCARKNGEKKLFFSNPGILSARHVPELLELSGEQGGMKVIRKYPESTYFYQIEAEKLRDIDTPEDLRGF